MRDVTGRVRQGSRGLVVVVAGVASVLHWYSYDE